jgi:hypothetical protein
MKERPCRRQTLRPDSHSIALQSSTAGKQTVEHMDLDSKSNNAPRRGLTSAVDLIHLRYAVAAADHGSFRRATEVLLLRQSKLSHCIRQLEERIEMIVFERSSGGVSFSALVSMLNHVPLFLVSDSARFPSSQPGRG